MIGAEIARSEVAAILLAAGSSRRFGEMDKLLAPLHALPLAAHAARTIVRFGIGTRFAVCPSAESALTDVLEREGFNIVVNPAPDQGLSSSLALGIESVIETPTKAVLVCLADMPFVTAAHLGALLDRFASGTREVVASSLDGIVMPPALFGAAKFGSLLELQGDRGARKLLLGADHVPASAHLLADIDCPTDLVAHRADGICADDKTA